MALIKCPRCELNYIQEEEKICSVCRREVRGESEQYDMIELCSECGEHPAVPGSELCAYCLKELSRHASMDDNADEPIAPAANIEIDSVTDMDEIELDLTDEPFEDGEKPDLDDEDDEDDDEDDEDEEE